MNTGPVLAAYILTDMRPISAAYITPTGHIQLSTGYAQLVNHPLSGNNPPVAMITASIGHSRELSKVAKIYTNKAKYSGCNDSFIFELAIFHDISSKADIPPNTKMKAFPTMLKRLALEYYYSNISISTVTLNFD